jgi:hypothetical protein
MFMVPELLTSPQLPANDVTGMIKMMIPKSAINALFIVIPPGKFRAYHHNTSGNIA